MCPTLGVPSESESSIMNAKLAMQATEVFSFLHTYEYGFSGVGFLKFGSSRGLEARSGRIARDALVLLSRFGYELLKMA